MTGGVTEKYHVIYVESKLKVGKTLEIIVKRSIKFSKEYYAGFILLVWMKMNVFLFMKRRQKKKYPVLFVVEDKNAQISLAIIVNHNTEILKRFNADFSKIAIENFAFLNTLLKGGFF